MNKYIEKNPHFYKRIVALALPITLQNLITMSVNLLDTIMLGQLGEVALSSAALGNQFIMLFQICCMGIGMGATVLISRYWGMQDFGSLKKVVTIALRFALAFAGIFTIANIIAPDLIIQLYTNDAAVIEGGTTYLRWSSPTFILMGMSLVSTLIMRSVGKGNIPLIASVLALFVNLGGNYIFIFGHFGAPEMGIAGAALGTVLARTVEFIIIVGVFFFKEKTIAYRIKDLFMKCGDLISEYIRISVPVLVSDALLAFGNTAIAMVMGRIGASFVAANSITTVTVQLSTVFIQGISFSGSIITGNTLGEGRVEDAKRQGYTFFFLGTLLGCVAGLLVFLSGDLVISAYKVAPETVDITKQLMNAVSFIIIFQASNSILTKGVLRGGGDTKFLMLADALFLWLASIPLGILAGLVLHLPPFWIFVCLKIDQIIKTVWCGHRLRGDKWIKKIKGGKG